jgi:hypothetical protein
MESPSFVVGEFVVAAMRLPSIDAIEMLELEPVVPLPGPPFAAKAGAAMRARAPAINAVIPEARRNIVLSFLWRLLVAPLGPRALVRGT